MDATYRKVETIGVKAPLKIQGGHFATSHAHTNYYIDLTTIKTRANEAQDIAAALVRMYLFSTVVDTIICMEGTEVIGAFLSEELTKGGYLNTNAHKTIYVVRPEFNSNSQIIFRDNIKPMIAGKHVMILMGSVITGKALNKAIADKDVDAIKAGTAALIAAVDAARKNLADKIAADKKAAEEAAAAEKAAYEAARCEALNNAKESKSSNIVYFHIGKYDIRNQERYKINNLIKKLNANPDLKAVLCGFADEETGEPDGNWVLSENRSKIVSEALQAAGIDPSRIETYWYGDTERISKIPEKNRATVLVTK